MTTLPLMQQMLGDQWEQLPPALQKHYQYGNNTDTGTLDIDYPGFMQLYLSIMRRLGALINRRGKHIPTTVRKQMRKGTQHWERSILYPDGDTILFKSYWKHAGGNELIEYINAFLGLRMAVHIKDGHLYYEGRHYVLKLGSVLLPIPEWLVLGHATIEEKAVGNECFCMDFRLRHPLFGQLFRYTGEFHTTEEAGQLDPGRGENANNR